MGFGSGTGTFGPAWRRARIAFLRSKLAAGVTECRAGNRGGEIFFEVETTGDEIVSVGVSGAGDALVCVENLVWALRLDPSFDVDSSFSFSLE